FPVRVLRKYGWAHSLHFSTDEEVVRSYRSTPPDAPWFIHLAEGMDDVAAGEYQRLKALGCVGKDTVIVHGVGMTDEDIADAAPRVRGLVWCPTTNAFMFDWKEDDWNRQFSKLSLWERAGGKWALGSDSRLTAQGDLLHEMKKVRHIASVTFNAAQILGDNSCADWLAVTSSVPDDNTMDAL